MIIIALIGPSAAGKTTLENYLVKEHNFNKIITTTTRPQGKGEIEGEDYYFITEEEFQRLKENDKFAEHDSNYGKSYGIQRQEFEKGERLVAVLNLSGAKSVRDLFPQKVHFVFVQPPSQEELKKRLIERGRDTEPGAIDKRLANSEFEIKNWKPECDYSVLADDEEIAFKDLSKILENILINN